MNLRTTEQFVRSGFDAIGIDHFALHDDTLAVARREGRLRRNFMGYTTRPKTESVAIGTSSISEISGIYAQNSPKLSDWQRAVLAGRSPPGGAWCSAPTTSCATGSSWT